MHDNTLVSIRALVLAASLTLGACFNPSYPTGQACSESQQCPPGQRCTEGVCQLDPDPTAIDAIDMRADSGPGQPMDVLQIAVGLQHTCAIIEDGAVRCWGEGDDGRLGYGNTLDVGVATAYLPRHAGNVDLGGPADKLVLGDRHTCALMRDGEVRCWGSNELGQLGSGIPGEVVGDDETPASHLPVRLDFAAIDLASHKNHTCALLFDGHSVQCWGQSGPHLGVPLGLSQNIGDDETPMSAGIIDAGNQVLAMDTGNVHTCVLVSGSTEGAGDVFCWGSGSYGRLGQGAIEDLPSMPALPVPLPGPVAAFDVGGAHSCALLSNDQVHCWGRGDQGRLGQGDELHIGDEPSDEFKAVMIGDKPMHVAAGGSHSCAILSLGELRCWGNAVGGRLGQAQISDNIGDDELPSSGAITIIVDSEQGERVVDVAAGGNHTCVLVSGGAAGTLRRVRCFGIGTWGALGYGGTQDVGDNEVPFQLGDVPIF